MANDTAEKYLHMSAIEEEKRAFKSLIEIKPHLIVDRRDIEMENQVRAIKAEVNTRKGGLDPNI